MNTIAILWILGAGTCSGSANHAVCERGFRPCSQEPPAMCASRLSEPAAEAWRNPHWVNPL